MMKIDIMTLFPEAVEGVLGSSIIGRGRKAGLLEINTHQIRDYAIDRHGRTDDYPYGGGKGMLMQCEPLYRCHSDITKGQHVHTVMMSAQGIPFDQGKAKELLAREHIIIVCGHYEGIDRRFIDECVDEEISLGDFVLTGGEIAAMAISDAICRMVPGVLAEDVCFEDESHYNGLLEYPQYTRPEIWHGVRVPEVLLSGHHENIRKWRLKQSLMLTKERRPDMFEKLEMSREEIEKILKE